MTTFFEDYHNLMASADKLAKTAENPHFRSKYVPLPEVLLEAKKLAFQNNFILIQYPSLDGLHTILKHSSGEQIEGVMPLVAKDPNDPQKLGGAMTYMRRYSLTCMLGLAEEDDDGNAAAGKTVAKASEKQLEYIRRLVEATGSDMTAVLSYYKLSKLPDISADDASDCIEMLKKKEVK